MGLPLRGRQGRAPQAPPASLAPIYPTAAAASTRLQGTTLAPLSLFSPPLHAFVVERDSQVWEGPRGMLGWPGSSTFHSLPCSTGLAVSLTVSPVPGHRGREEGSSPLSVLPWEGSGSWVKSLLVLAPPAGVSRGCVPEPGV